MCKEGLLTQCAISSVAFGQSEMSYCDLGKLEEKKAANQNFSHTPIYKTLHGTPDNMKMLN